MSAYCPNCSAPLASAAISACENCDATFTHAEGWKPVPRPPGQFVPRVKRADVPVKAAPEQLAIPLGEKIIRAAIAVPLLLTGFGLFVLALSQLGGLAGVPGALCIAIGIGVLVSRSTAATIISISSAGILYLFVFGALKFVNAAIYSR